MAIPNQILLFLKQQSFVNKIVTQIKNQNFLENSRFSLQGYFWLFTKCA
jgi:hypothetical protein